jgi:hypothetical protein
MCQKASLMIAATRLGLAAQVGQPDHTVRDRPVYQAGTGSRIDVRCSIVINSPKSRGRGTS